MKRSSYEQFAIVHADSASLFNQQLNEEIRRLKDNSPVVHFSESIPFYAQIKYIVNEEAPETIAEASAVENPRPERVRLPEAVDHQHARLHAVVEEALRVGDDVLLVLVVV